MRSLGGLFALVTRKVCSTGTAARYWHYRPDSHTETVPIFENERLLPERVAMFDPDKIVKVVANPESEWHSTLLYQFLRHLRLEES